MTDILFWYFVQGLLTLFWVSYLDGSVSGDKWWHLPANVGICILGWPVLMVALIIKDWNK